MSLAKSCRLCEYYLPHGEFRDQGICNRLDDSDFTYSIQAENEQCIYETPGATISESDYAIELKKKQEKHRSMIATLERAERIADSWPDWKRNALGAFKRTPPP